MWESNSPFSKKIVIMGKNLKRPSLAVKRREDVVVMKKENLLTYLEAQLEKQLGDYDFAIDWNTKDHTVEVIVVLYAQNQAGTEIEDATGVNTEEDVIEFEDSVLLYDPSRGEVDPEEYLAVLPYAGKKGLDKRTIDVLARYLREVLTTGESDLLDFLGDEEAAIFELKWEQAAFEELLAASKASTDFVAYPKY